MAAGETMTHEYGDRVYKVWMRRRGRPDPREGICRGHIVRLSVMCITTGLAVCTWDGARWVRRPGSPESRAAVLDILGKYN